MKHLFPYNWNISNGYPSKNIKNHGKKVFSCFAGGGGSTMGYKLAGYDVIGMNEIDPKMAECYIKNHYPKYAFIEPIQEFKKRQDLPKELFDLAILDGSFPCSSFSMAGNREKDWGKKKQFREGQQKQVLDTLAFDFIDLAKRLQPKIVVMENVTGIIKGNAKKYAKKVLSDLDKAGYKTEYFVLDASKMGVPQKRERVFFIGVRNDVAEKLPKDEGKILYEFPYIDLEFSEKEIPFKDIEEINAPLNPKVIPSIRKLYPHVKKGDKFEYAALEINGKAAFFSSRKVHPNKPLYTITANRTYVACQYHYEVLRTLTKQERLKGGTFPFDYDFCNDKKFIDKYVIGMSVPPIMMAQLSYRIYTYWLSKI